METMTPTQLASRIIRNGIKSFADSRPNGPTRSDVDLANAMLYALHHLELEIEELERKLEASRWYGDAS